MITVTRFDSSARGTFGILNAGRLTLRVAEKAWRNNKRRVSCIPPGEYAYSYLPRTASGRWRDVLWLRDVPGRSGIMIHPFNYPSESLGCLAVGLRFLRKRGEIVGVFPSAVAVRRLVRSVPREGKIFIN